jgi:hypothetical protein
MSAKKAIEWQITNVSVMKIIKKGLARLIAQDLFI